MNKDERKGRFLLPAHQLKRLELITNIVGEKMGLLFEDINVKVREPNQVKARQIIIYVYRKLYPYKHDQLSLPSIGKYFDSSGANGPLDHSTVIHSLKKAQDYYTVEKDYRQLVDSVIADVSKRDTMRNLFKNYEYEKTTVYKYLLGI
jgi:chromosomal replication initiation ATPase DnaA